MFAVINRFSNYAPHIACASAAVGVAAGFVARRLDPQGSEYARLVQKIAFVPMAFGAVAITSRVTGSDFPGAIIALSAYYYGLELATRTDSNRGNSVFAVAIAVASFAGVLAGER